ncbi:unnamed protein product, partial [marine sediment metagenome]
PAVEYELTLIVDTYGHCEKCYARIEQGYGGELR